VLLCPHDLDDTASKFRSLESYVRHGLLLELLVGPQNAGFPFCSDVFLHTRGTTTTAHKRARATPANFATTRPVYMSAPALHDSFFPSIHAPPPLLEKITTPSHLSTMGSIPPPNTDLQVFYETHPADQNWVNDELIPFLDLVYGPKARGFWTQKIGEITLQLPDLVHLHPSSTRLFPESLTLLLLGSTRGLCLNHRALPHALDQSGHPHKRRD
jgi:hypothetical protein